MTETLTENKMGYGSYKPNVGWKVFTTRNLVTEPSKVLADESKSSARPLQLKNSKW